MKSQTPKEIQEWYTQIEPILKQYGLLPKIGLIWIIITIILGLTSLGVFFYTAQAGYFDTQINQSINPQINNTINQQYDFTPSTQNNNKYYNNFTINIPTQNCLCDCGEE